MIRTECDRRSSFGSPSKASNGSARRSAASMRPRSRRTPVASGCRSRNVSRTASGADVSQDAQADRSPAPQARRGTSPSPLSASPWTSCAFRRASSFSSSASPEARHAERRGNQQPQLVAHPQRCAVLAVHQPDASARQRLEHHLHPCDNDGRHSTPECSGSDAGASDGLTPGPRLLRAGKGGGRLRTWAPPWAPPDCSRATRASPSSRMSTGSTSRPRPAFSGRVPRRTAATSSTAAKSGSR